MGGFTTLDLAERALRWCEPRSVGKLDAGEKMQLADAIGYGLAEFYSNSSSTKRTANSTIAICAPEDVEITLEEDSAAITGYEFAADQIGCSIGMPSSGDVYPKTQNEVAGPTMLMEPWRGSSGTQTVRIYHDAFGFGSSVRKLLTDPLLKYKGDLSRRLRRARWDEAIKESYYSNGAWSGGSGWGSGYGYRNHAFNLGEPDSYAIYELGNSQNSPWEFILKIHPSPTAAMSMTVNVDFDPEMPCWETLSNFPTELPITPTQFNLCLFPMVEHRLLSSTMWVGSDDVKAEIKEANARAMREVQKSVVDRAPRMKKRLGMRPGW